MVGRPTIDADQQHFLKTLQDQSGPTGNGRMLDLLKWSDDRYWRTHSALVDQGAVARGRGRGGSVILVDQTAPPTDEAIQQQINSTLPGSPPLESSLYIPARDVIETKWAVERAFDRFRVEITARSGSGTGIWTRPDITVVAEKTYQYLPGRSFEIITFEIKKSDSVDVRGVFEALSHRQFATMSYLLFHTGGETLSRDDINFSRLRDIARDHGVGLISAQKIDDFGTWEELVEPRRNTYNPEQANLFINSSLSENSKAEIIRWQK